nr:E2/UBC family protein [Solimonas sp. SE-A11]
MQFLVTPCGNVGYTGLQVQFAELKLHYPKASLVGLGGNSMVLVPDFPLRQGWSVEKVELMYLVPAGFPTGALDMFYVDPHLSLADGRQPANADTVEQHGGKPWQRFSWHYQRPWKPGRDTLLSHLDFCRSRLQMLN